MNKTKSHYPKLIMLSFLLVIFGLLFIFGGNGEIKDKALCKISQISFVSKALSQSCPAGKYWKCNACYPTGYTACTDSHGLCVVCSSGQTCKHYPSTGAPYCEITGGSGGGGGSGVSTCNCSINVSATKSTINQGDSTTIFWNSNGGAWIHGVSGGLFCCPGGASTCPRCSNNSECPNQVCQSSSGYCCYHNCVSCSNIVSPTSTREYWIRMECADVSGKDCGSVVGKTTINVIPKPIPPPTTQKPTITLSASPSLISSGGLSTLSWSSTNATKVELKGPDIPVPRCVGCFGLPIALSGIYSVKPPQTGTYTVQATGPGGIATSSLVITVLSSAPGATFNFNPTSIYLNQSSTLSWNISNSTKQAIGISSKCGATPAQPAFPVSAVSSQSVKGDCAGSITYYMNVYGTGGLKRIYATLTVNSGTPPPTPTPTPKCYATGCNGTICSNKQFATTCEWKPEYECYQKYSNQCQLQSSGACGWQMTGELKSCLDSYNTTIPPTPVPTPTPSPECNAHINEGTVKFNQNQGQYYLVKKDGNSLNLNPKPSSQIDLQKFLDHEVKVRGCLKGINLELLEITVIDVPVEVLAEEQKQQETLDEKKPLVNITSLLATGGSLGFNIIVALVLSALASYFIIKRPIK